MPFSRRSWIELLRVRPVFVGAPRHSQPPSSTGQGRKGLRTGAVCGGSRPARAVGRGGTLPGGHSGRRRHPSAH